MSSSYDPQYAPAGDVGAALMAIDSRLKAVYDGKTATDPQQQVLIDQFTASLGPEGARDLVDGACTLIFMFMTWLRKAHEAHDKDVIEYVVPHLVQRCARCPGAFDPRPSPPWPASSSRQAPA